MQRDFIRLPGLCELTGDYEAITRRIETHHKIELDYRKAMSEVHEQCAQLLARTNQKLTNAQPEAR